MESKFAVSVIVATYEPEWEKLQYTLRSVMAQEDVSLEIIVTDDGSARDFFPEIENELKKDSIPFRLHKNEKNVGTIRNCLSGVTMAQGKYVFLISPGDLLFDRYVLRDFYAFAEDGEKKLVFGKSVYYGVEDDSLMIYRGEPAMPRFPRVYSPEVPPLNQRVSFCMGNYILGAAYFRERETCLTYMEQAAEIAVYTEDTVSTALAMADGVRVWFFPRTVVWYEYGTGISSKEDSWQEKLRSERDSLYALLKKRYPRDPAVVMGCLFRDCPSRKKALLQMLLRHPLLLMWELAMRNGGAARIGCSEEDEDRLICFLEGRDPQ